jgi:hypothetical protein
MISATGDWTKNTPEEEYPAIRSVYELYGKADLVESIQFDAEHNYNRKSREAVYRFFGKHVLGDAEASHFAEKNFRVEKLQDLLVLHNNRLPENALNYEQLVQQWIAAAKRQSESADPASLRERLRLVLAVEEPAQVVSEPEGEGRVVLGRPGKGDRVPAIWAPGKGTALLMVSPEGSEAARNLPEARECLRAGRPLLAIDAYQTGRAAVPRAAPGRQYLVFNRSDPANRVQDILTGLAFLAGKGAASVTLTGTGDAAIWSVFAAAAAKTPVAWKADLGDFRGEDSDFIARFFVPGIQRAGGLKAALRLVQGN